MANEQNLTQMGKPLSRERAQEMGRRSAEARRKKAEERKTAREFARAALNAKIKNKETGEEYVVKDAMIRKLIQRAVQEVDLTAIKYLLELIGESPQQADIKDAEDAIEKMTGSLPIERWLDMEKEIDSPERV